MSNKLNKDVQRATRAKQLLDDPMIQEIMVSMRHNLHRKIETSEYKNADEREECYRMLRTLESFEGQFKKIMQSGTSATETLTAMQRVVKRVQEI